MQKGQSERKRKSVNKGVRPVTGICANHTPASSTSTSQSPGPAMSLQSTLTPCSTRMQKVGISACRGDTGHADSGEPAGCLETCNNFESSRSNLGSMNDASARRNHALRAAKVCCRSSSASSPGAGPLHRTRVIGGISACYAVTKSRQPLEQLQGRSMVFAVLYHS